MNTKHEKQVDVMRRDADKSWFDKHISSGNLLNLAFIVFLAGGGWFVMKDRMDRYEDRLEKVENLNIRTAELVIQLSQFQRQLDRVESRLVGRIDTLVRRIETLERDVRIGRDQATEDRREMRRQDD